MTFASHIVDWTSKVRPLWTAIVGGITFWAPDVFIHAVERETFGGGAVLAITLLMPASTAWAFLRLDAFGRTTVRGWSRAYLMLLGIWTLGPLFMMTSATFSGGGFQTLEASDWVMLVHPVATFSMAGYDGALGALLLITLILPIMSFIGRSPRHEGAQQ